MGFLVRRRPFLAALGAALSSGWCGGLGAIENSLPAIRRHFAVVGTLSPPHGTVGQGFSGVHVAPRWVLTAAHIQAGTGWIFASDFGMSGVAEVLSFPTTAPTRPPLEGIPRDDVALVRLARPVDCPHFPRLADDATLRALPRTALTATMVSNNPGLNDRRFGYSQLRLLKAVPGYSLAETSRPAEPGSLGGPYLVPGDSGSPLFLGRLLDCDFSSVLVGIASAQFLESSGTHHAVYSRVGVLRRELDEAVHASGERLRWTAGSGGSSGPG